MRIPITSPTIRNEAARFLELAEGGTDEGWRRKLPLDGRCTLEFRTDPGALTDGLLQTARSPVEKRVRFRSIESGSYDHIQLQVDYEFREDGSIHREIHERSGVGDVVLDSLTNGDGTMRAQAESSQELSEQSRRDLEQWNIAF